MNIDFDDLMNDLPRVEASSRFKEDLLDQIPLNTPTSSPRGILKMLAPIAMAASLACGLFVGVADVDVLSTALSGLGISVDQTTIAGEWASTVSPYATNFGEL